MDTDCEYDRLLLNLL